MNTLNFNVYVIDYFYKVIHFSTIAPYPHHHWMLVFDVMSKNGIHLYYIFNFLATEVVNHIFLCLRAG